MRGTEDPPPPLHHVLQDGLGFEQVVTCVEIKTFAHGSVSIQTRVAASALGVGMERRG